MDHNTDIFMILFSRNFYRSLTQQDFVSVSEIISFCVMVIDGRYNVCLSDSLFKWVHERLLDSLIRLCPHIHLFCKSIQTFNKSPAMVYTCPHVNGKRIRKRLGTRLKLSMRKILDVTPAYTNISVHAVHTRDSKRRLFSVYEFIHFAERSRRDMRLRLRLCRLPVVERRNYIQKNIRLPTHTYTCGRGPNDLHPLFSRLYFEM